MNSFQSAIKNIESFFKPRGSLIHTDEEKLSIEDIIYSKQYPLEIHNVETEDGYMLRVYRIPGHKSEERDSYKNGIKMPVLFQHGILDSSDGWVCNSENKCLPFILANMGYDVWLSNSRGNKHSKYHNSFNPISYEFWQFSFHEMGLYDIPAILNHIKNYNKSGEKVIYIGHSQGTCMLFSALTQKLQYFQNNIKLFIALAPVAKVGSMNSSFLKFLKSIHFHKLLKTAKQHEVFPNTEKNNKFNSWINKNFSSMTNLMLDMISDKNSKENNNLERLGVYLTHYPAGTSLKAINHFIQNYNSKKFNKYDYKEEANMFIYKQSEPCEYDLKQINNFPIALISGKEDKLASPDDVKWLREELGSNVVYFKEYDNMGHITFLMGKDITWFKETLEFMVKFTSNTNEVD